MSGTSNIKSEGLVTFSIKVEGTTIPDTVGVLSIHIDKAINRIGTAKIVVIDGEPATGEFKVSSSSTFIPGNKVTIEAGYDRKNQTIFKGIVTQQSIEISGLGSKLIVECKDAAYQMIVGRKSLTYAKKTDSDIISSIIGTYSGLDSDVSSTTTEWPEQVQYYVTDWDFIISRAESNGLIVNVIDGKVNVKAPNADTSSVLTIAYGDNLYEFNANLNSITQLESVKATAWSYKEQTIVNSEASNDHAGAGNLSSKKLAEDVHNSNFELQTGAPLEKEDLTNWSKAQLVKSEYSKIQGEAKFQGTALVNPGTYITLKGLGDRFNGDHFVSQVIHAIEGGNWMTETIIGIPSDWFIERPDVIAPSASGLLPGARGLFNATVKKMYEDTDNQFRILIDIPLFDAAGEGIWARLSNFYSTNGAGVFFLPEVGDEVIVGFINEDPRYPIILGSLYSDSKIKPFEGLEPDEKNSIKAIVSKSGINIQFDDENKVLTLTTPGKNTAILSDKDKQITIQDQNSNSIVMSDSGIVMKSPKDISIEASQNLTLKGDQGVTISSSGGDVQVDGINIKQSAQMEYSAEGSTTAQVQGGTELTLKGAMVMIN